MFFVIKNYGNVKGCQTFWTKKKKHKQKMVFIGARAINKEIRARSLR